MLMTVDHHRTRPQTTYIPGEGGVWLFIAGDLLAFTLFFVTFFVHRLEDPALFASATTGVHLFHVLLGMGVLTWLLMHLGPGMAEQTQLRNLESGATFWYLVDLLWIVLFALFYLIP
jgi:heme/copper-type cytochrome/quinol oxidase subunit 3